jgi:acetoin:2,6-dichlorophenolindophenol oxidoreductase subunit beta
MVKLRQESEPITFRDAIREALQEEMARDSSVMILGEDLGVGATWGTTAGLVDEFPGRVRDTPISETAIIGFSVGAAMTGLRPVPEIMFADLTTVAMDEIVNQAAKMRYMTAGQARVPMVIRIPCGLSKNIGAQGCQAVESWFVHVPGLLIVVPSTPADAKGLLKTAIRSDDPVLFFEYRLLYATKGVVPVDADYLVPFGAARVVRSGADLTIVSSGRCVGLVEAAADALQSQGIAAEIIDLRTLMPLDEEALVQSVRRTGRMLLVEEECERASAGAWIVARVQEDAFTFLRGPIRRVASLNTPKPVAPELEQFVFPNVDRIVRAAKETMAGKPGSPGIGPYWTGAVVDRS